MVLHIRRPQPRAPILLKRLYPGFKYCLLQPEVIDRANARDAVAWEATAATVHQRATDAAETVFHIISSGDGLILAMAGKLGLAAGVLEVCVFYYEVAGEHAGLFLLVGCTVRKWMWYVYVDVILGLFCCLTWPE